MSCVLKKGCLTYCTFRMAKTLLSFGHSECNRVNVSVD